MGQKDAAVRCFCLGIARDRKLEVGHVPQGKQQRARQITWVRVLVRRASCYLRAPSRIRRNLQRRPYFFSFSLLRVIGVNIARDALPTVAADDTGNEMSCYVYTGLR